MARSLFHSDICSEKYWTNSIYVYNTINRILLRSLNFPCLWQLTLRLRQFHSHIIISVTYWVGCFLLYYSYYFLLAKRSIWQISCRFVTNFLIISLISLKRNLLFMIDGSQNMNTNCISLSSWSPAWTHSFPNCHFTRPTKN